MRKNVFFAFLALTMLFATACTEDIEKVAFRTIGAAAISYNLVMQSVADAQNDGLITVEQRKEINVYAQEYYDAFHKASKALRVYLKYKDPTLEQLNTLLQAKDKAMEKLKTLKEKVLGFGISFEEPEGAK